MEIKLDEIRKLFDEQKVAAGKPSISISAILDTIKEPFDQVGVATKTYEKNFNNPKSEYYQMTVDQICENWSNRGKTSCHYGSLNDDYIGYVLNNDTDNLELFELDYDREGDERLNGNCTSFDHFKHDIIDAKGWQYVTREKMVYYDAGEFYVRGRFDALFYNPMNGHYIIIDWKTSGDIEKPNKWTKKLLGPCKEIDSINHNTYTIQVYFYKKVLEEQILPAGSIVDVYIVQLPGHIIEDKTGVLYHESGKDYGQYGPNIKYDSVFFDRLYKWSFKKKQLLDKMNKKNEEVEE